MIPYDNCASRANLTLPIREGLLTIRPGPMDSPGTRLTGRNPTNPPSNGTIREIAHRPSEAEMRSLPIVRIMSLARHVAFGSLCLKFGVPLRCLLRLGPQRVQINNVFPG